MTREWTTETAAETEAVGEEIAALLTGGTVLAMYGDLGAGKTTFVRGLARGMGLDAEVSSPTFALVHEYGGEPPLVHFDMYRVTGWDDLYSTGYYDYLDAGAILAVEWSENIAAALPDTAWKLDLSALSDQKRRIVLTTPEKGNDFT